MKKIIYYIIWNNKGYFIRSGVFKNKSEMDQYQLKNNEVLEYSKNVKDIISSIENYKSLLNS